MLRLCSMLLQLMIFFSGVSLVLLIPGSKQASRLSFIFIKMADMVSAWVIPIEPVIDGSMHLCTGWKLMASLRSPNRNNFISNRVSHQIPFLHIAGNLKTPLLPCVTRVVGAEKHRRRSLLFEHQQRRNDKSCRFLRNRCLVTPKEFLRNKLSITTQNFLNTVYWFEE